jgi:hypothetical protein
MPDRRVEDIVPIPLQPFIGKVPGERERCQQQDATDGVDGRFADRGPDRAQASAAELTAISLTR